MGKKLSLETTAPFQGLPELVAHDEGLFEKEGLDVEFIARGQSAPNTTNTGVTSTDNVSPFLSHASSFEGGPGRDVQRLRVGQLPQGPR